MRLFDSHCHLDDSAFFHDFMGVREHMAAAGVAAAMVVGVDLESSRRALLLAENHAELYADRKSVV